MSKFLSPSWGFELTREVLSWDLALPSHRSRVVLWVGEARIIRKWESQICKQIKAPFGQMLIRISGAYFWFGGLAVMLAAFGEWLLGNTFAFTVFSGYGMSVPA